jgi:adenine phosphoribosyltransferase
VNTIHLKEWIRPVPDFPMKGINFKDITPLLAEPFAFESAVREMAKVTYDFEPEVIAGIEARGFVFAAPMAYKMYRSLVLLRKGGKLPVVTHSHSYELEYGKAVMELNGEAIAGKRVVIVDDVLATGGTARAAAELCKQAGGEVVGFCFLIDLTYLHGASVLPAPVKSVIAYDV